MICIKVHKSSRDVVAVCDKDILGRKFEEDIRQLDVREGFFGGKEVSEEEAVKLLRLYKQDDATFNIVGINSVACAKEAEIVLEGNISTIQNVPFALILA